MTITLHVSTVITAISGLSISGLTVCDLDDIPNSLDIRTSYLLPSPAEPAPITGFRLERVTTGMSTAEMDAYYTLNYLLMYCPVGVGRGLMDIYPGLVGMIEDVIEAILGLATLNGAVVWTPAIGEIAPHNDPSGAAWHAAIISVEVHDFVQ